MRKRWLLLLLLSFGACFGTWATLDLQSRARRSNDEIRAEIIGATPIGTTYSVANAYIRNNFGHVFEAWPNGEKVKVNLSTVVYGYYYEVRHFPFATVVKVSWQFDADGVLDKIAITRYIDSL